MTTETTTQVKSAIEPLEDRVLVQPLEAQEKIGSVFLPDQAKEKPTQGIVLAHGPGKHEGGSLVPMPVAKGDVVIYSKYAGTAVKLNGEDCVILRANDCLAKVYDQG